MIANNSHLNQLFLLLQQLDQLLAEAIAAAQVAYGTEAATNNKIPSRTKKGGDCVKRNNHRLCYHRRLIKRDRA